MARMPTYFISHGGGPWPWMPDWRARFVNLEASFNAMVKELPETPKAILMISGHWEDDSFAVMSSAQPPMVYDYHGFPPHTFEIQYKSPGAPELAQRTADLIAAAGLPVRLDPVQGYDHGTFVPAYVMYPDASVPLFQVSLRKGYSPEEHLALGRALAPLRDEGVLILGSGLSYHNLRNFGPGAKVPSEAFDKWLGETLALPPAERTAQLLDWEKAPHAREAHAEEDHFIPVYAALGAAEGEVATRVYHDTDLFGGVTASSYRFG
ncbi:class III extradiol ring-cleavage dioxygenase [Xinfangfangia sp. CPCC 101601]|uniref:Class III extradiol ring-cleavage dioxygenase n=1 Tax=Pseudogemmobacter lacusdianii TaxID=3069608 RepID=A0ABU0W0R2_9RHOB|nr:class III extradiol ring-cleavage dioxygenase [Xinfangfangia sp. CPCC 101601]MDQ2067348.1 class III extradiol ring-cleavage dioxygenase [Xinfangfangia sp. CPCC 101601]